MSAALVQTCCASCVSADAYGASAIAKSCVHHATLLGVTGWVRNRGDGSVEALVQGSGDELERMVDWLRRGPAMVRVDDVRVEELPSSPRFERFERRASE